MGKLSPLIHLPKDSPFAVLAEGNAELVAANTRVVGMGQVLLSLEPRGSIVISCRFSGIPPVDAMAVAFGSHEGAILRFEGRQIDGFWRGIGGEPMNGELSLRWIPASEPLCAKGDDSTSIERVVFHIFNFKKLRSSKCSWETVAGTRYRIDHVDLVSDSWKARLQSLPGTHGEIDRLRERGGYALTHLVEVTRVDGAAFTGGDAARVLHALRYFLSFAKGTWCEPVCPMGLDSSGKSVWEMWSSPQLPWSEPRSWSDEYHACQFSTLFSGFMDKWEDPTCLDALRTAVYWYLLSNDPSHGADAGIILSQAALERLAFEYLVSQGQKLSRTAFKSMPASAKIKELLLQLGIPVSIPVSLPRVSTLAGNQKWQDGPRALTEIRNSLVHPPKRNLASFDDAQIETWNLGQWYLELILLRICGYADSYRNRLLTKPVGAVEKVPWTP